jgi:hypothetical protein
VATDKLDLQISVSSTSPSTINPCVGNYPEVRFKIVNNSAAPVNLNTLTIKAWFLGNVTIGYWGGDNWRTRVYDSTGTDQSTPVTGTLTSATGSFGNGQTSQLTFGFSDSVTIPANGGYALAGFDAVDPFYQLKNADAAFDPTCGDYSDMGGASFYSSATYYENPHWVLYESGNSVCEWTNSSTKDSSTGIPAGGATCACP